MEKTNIRYLTPEETDDEISFVSVDVSFISLTKVLLPVKRLMTEEGEVVCLIKPQFEAGRENVGKKVLSGIKGFMLKLLRWYHLMRMKLDLTVWVLIIHR